MSLHDEDGAIPAGGSASNFDAGLDALNAEFDGGVGLLLSSSGSFRSTGSDGESSVYSAMSEGSVGSELPSGDVERDVGRAPPDSPNRDTSRRELSEGINMFSKVRRACLL